MSGIQLAAAADTAVRLPLRVLGTLLALVWALVGGLVLTAWYGVVLPVLWVLLGVPFAVLAAVVTRRRHSSGHLGRRLRRQRSAWRSNRGYRFARLGDIYRQLRRWGR